MVLARVRRVWVDGDRQAKSAATVGSSLLSVFFLEPTYATFRFENTLFSSEERMRRR
jgi:hypothetical protein